ncbi:dihydroneopterin aldolase [Streptococcus dentasini]
MDKIILEGCRFYAYHGAMPEENALGQVFIVDVELGLDLGSASQTDELADTVHYGLIFETIRHEVENQTYQLLEGLAGAICQDIFEQFLPIQTIKIKITKENPPIKGHYNRVGIELERRR